MSNLFKRVIVGLIGIPVLMFIFYSGGILFLIFSLIVTSLALRELFSMFEKKNYFPLKNTGIILSAGILVYSFFYFTNFTDIDFLFLIYLPVIFLICAEIFRREKINPLNPVIVIFGLLYITTPFAMLGIINEYSKLNLVLFIFVLIWTCDTAAYFGGKYLGKHLLSPISPKKTWEGSITGFIFTVIVSFSVQYIFPDKLNLTDALIMGITIGIFSQVGDLFESLLKRYCDVKDSSDIIPGHGGILDRFDSIIFVTPLIFIYFRYIK